MNNQLFADITLELSQEPQVAAEMEIKDTPEDGPKKRPFYAPGWYSDLSNDDYHSSFGYSSSNLKVLTEKTMAHLQYEMSNRGETTEAMLKGQIFHTLTMEPHLFEQEFAIRPDGLKKPTKAQVNAANPSEETVTLLNAVDAWDLEKGNRVEITHAQYNHARAMADKVREHPKAAMFLESGIAEQSVYSWYQPEDWDGNDDYRLMMKARPDWIVPGHNVVFDLKSSKSAAYSDFMKQSRQLGYHFSAAMYLDILNRELKRNKKFRADMGIFSFTQFVWIVAENKPPYEVACYECSAGDLNEGAQLYHRAVRKLDMYNRSEWKGYGDSDGEQITPDVRMSEFPRWNHKIV